MKTKNLVTVLGMVFLLVNLSSCNKDASSVPGTIQLNASTKNDVVKSVAIQTAAGTITLQTASIEIQNVTIEENSGNDNENNNVDGGTNNEGKDNEKKNQEKDGGDVVLPGPYVLDIVNGSAIIDKVSVQPGTYKKVNFDFVAGPKNNENSIIITGEYTSAAGVTIPLELTSDLNSTIQLPLTNNINVSSGNTVSISVVFDVVSWLNSLDFENADVINDKIIINSGQNIKLYNAFIAEISRHVEIEN